MRNASPQLPFLDGQPRSLLPAVAPPTCLPGARQRLQQERAGPEVPEGTRLPRLRQEEGETTRPGEEAAWGPLWEE